MSPRLALRVGGVICLLLGTIWLLQGANVLGGSRMSGDSFWFWVGALLIAAGAALLYAGLRRRIPR